MNNDKKTKIILICALLIAFGVLAVYVALINRPSPTIITPTTTAEVDENTEDAAIPSPITEIDYSQLYNQIIPASAENGNIGDHVRGNVKAKVVIIEYADLQCPGCAALMLFMSNLYNKNSDNVAFIFRHFPLSIHPNAGLAALAAESAGVQGYFWEMTESMYSNQGIWAEKTGDDLKNAFISIFKKVAPNGDIDKFTANLENTNFATKVAFDHDLGRAYHNVRATPSVFVNGKEYDVMDYSSYSDLAKAIQTEIDRLLSE